MSDPIQKLRAYLAKNGEAKLPNELTDTPNLDYAVDRFGLAYCTNGSIGPDETVLLRQVVRWSDTIDIRIDRLSDQSEQMGQWFEKAGLKWSPGGYLSADPYAPNWLDGKPIIIDNRPYKRSINECFTGEPYLKQNLGFEKWLSPAQKEAAWMVLNAPEGSTCTVVLPTGGGKSSCFWLLPTFMTGLTVVVVPTIALAIDQQHSASKRYDNYPGINPCFFASDDNPEVTVAKLKNKESRLVFASPETCVSGHLRSVLNTFARDGWFKNLVIDEAHLIETWGAQFRVEFQLLSAVRKEWLISTGNKLRTFLFSATMSPQCRNTLTEMFTEENNYQEFLCQRLRPEISYFGHNFYNDNERYSYLLEAIWRLPRPVILYLTKPDDAQRLYSRLKDEEGFKRIGCFTGETKRNERKELLENWKSNRIDLMVATSAFGVGVDKADVRTVIHACYPENLDRYYQEVGRSGRDGYGSVCMLIPTERDKEIAKSLGIKILKDTGTIQQRWEAMYNNRRLPQEKEYICKLPVSVRRLALMGNQTYSQNIIWNKSLLLQMYRAKLIDFKDLKLESPYDSNDELEEWATVEINFPPGNPNLGKRLGDISQKELEHFNIGFSQLEEVLSPTRCISRVLQNIYQIPSDQIVCGGCRFCREKDRTPSSCPPLLVPEKDVVPNKFKGTIIENWPDPTQPNQRDEFIDRFEDCLRKYNLRPIQIYCPYKHFENVLKVLEGVFNQYRELYRIDPFSEGTVLRSFENHHTLFLHIGFYSEIMLEKALTCNPIHLFCGIQKPYDSMDRHIKIKYDCNSWISPQVYLGQIN